jgi:hypothetical protein
MLVDVNGSAPRARSLIASNLRPRRGADLTRRDVGRARISPRQYPRPDRRGLGVANPVAVAYDDLGQAKRVMETIDLLRKVHAIELEDAVIVEHGTGGEMKRLRGTVAT